MHNVAPHGNLIVTQKPKPPIPQAKAFQLSWETEADPEDTGRENFEEESGEDDFEGHASGFNRPSS
ncbi:MAG: hypothetical protein QOE91_1206 [Gaiellaceae bacterium]|nr:hypothetical protein [Gaiellaceae bacterium]